MYHKVTMLKIILTIFGKKSRTAPPKNCRPTVGRLLANSRTTVGRQSDDSWRTLGQLLFAAFTKIFCQQSVDCWLFVGPKKLSADSWPTRVLNRHLANKLPTCGQQSADSRPTVGRQSDDSRTTVVYRFYENLLPAVGRLLAVCRPTVGRLLAACR